MYTVSHNAHQLHETTIFAAHVLSCIHIYFNSNTDYIIPYMHYAGPYKYEPIYILLFY